jgi:acyl dehydratase
VIPPGCPEIAVVQAVSQYFVPLRPGDTARSEIRMKNCSAKKATKLGEGYFVTAERLVYNQRSELVRTFELTTLHYHV